MTLHTTLSVKLGRLPGLARDDEFPLPEGTNTLPQTLVLAGTSEQPDVFDLQERITLHTVGQDAPYVGRRYAALERHLARVYEGIERVDSEDAPDSRDVEAGEGSSGETDNTPEGEA